MIKPIKTSDTTGLNRLTPRDWNLDYEAFLQDFLKEDFFYAFILMHEERAVATGNVFIKGKIGWLANIMVDLNYRTS